MRFPCFGSVRARLTLWNVGVLAVTLLILGAIAGIAVARSLTASIDRDLANRVQIHQSLYTSFRERTGRDMLTIVPPMHPPHFASEPLQLRVFTRSGIPPPMGNNKPAWNDTQLQTALAGNVLYSFARVDGERARILSAPLRYNGEVGGAVQAVYLLNDVERVMSNLHHTLLLLIPVALLASGVGGLLLTSRVLRPVRQVTEAAARIGAEDLSQRLTVTGSDEFSALARTFNAMLSRLEASWEQQRRFTADASHELRTPLTVIKANATLALSESGLESPQRGSWEATNRAADFMTAIVRDLLLLSTSDAGQLTLNLQPLNLREAVESAAETALAGNADITFANHLPPDLVVRGDTTLVLRLLVNLIKNAAQHTPEGGSISLMAACDVFTPRVCVTVTDTGIGIAPEHLPHLGERFYRVDGSRDRKNGGTGLGLAICREIARAHGGSLTIESTVGRGTTVGFTLHLAAGDSEACREL